MDQVRVIGTLHREELGTHTISEKPPFLPRLRGLPAGGELIKLAVMTSYQIRLEYRHQKRVSSHQLAAEYCGR